jgi:hypothetical protein
MKWKYGRECFDIRQITQKMVEQIWHIRVRFTKYFSVGVLFCPNPITLKHSLRLLMLMF